MKGPNKSIETETERFSIFTILLTPRPPQSIWAKALFYSFYSSIENSDVLKTSSENPISILNQSIFDQSFVDKNTFDQSLFDQSLLEKSMFDKMTISNQEEGTDWSQNIQMKKPKTFSDLFNHETSTQAKTIDQDKSKLDHDQLILY